MALKQKTLNKYKVDTITNFPINFDGIRMQADEQYGNQVWDKHFGDIYQILFLQKKHLQYLGFLDPYMALHNLSIGLTSNDLLHHHNFLRQVEVYRRNFVKALNDKHAYGGSKTGEWFWKADQDFYNSIHDFKHSAVSISVMIPNYFLDIIVFLSWFIVLIFSIIISVKKIELL